MNRNSSRKQTVVDLIQQLVECRFTVEQARSIAEKLAGPSQTDKTLTLLTTILSITAIRSQEHGRRLGHAEAKQHVVEVFSEAFKRADEFPVGKTSLQGPHPTVSSVRSVPPTG